MSAHAGRARCITGKAPEFMSVRARRQLWRSRERRDDGCGAAGGLRSRWKYRPTARLEAVCESGLSFLTRTWTLQCYENGHTCNKQTLKEVQHV
jgi:hypothetical protein